MISKTTQAENIADILELIKKYQRVEKYGIEIMGIQKTQVFTLKIDDTTSATIYLYEKEATDNVSW